MTALPYPIYDADNHLYEPPEAFLRYLPRAYSKEFQYVQVEGRTKLAIGGFISDYIPNPTFEVVAAPGAHELWYRGKNTQGLSLRELTGKPLSPPPDSFFHAEARLKMLDEQGLHAAVIIPTLASVIENRLSHKPEVVGALFHSLNQYLLDEWGFAREDRLFPVPMVNLSDVDGAVAELEFVLKNGAKVIGLRPAPVTGLRGNRSPGMKEFDPFWGQVNEAGIFVYFHASDSGYDRFNQYWTNGSAEFLPFQADAFRGALDLIGRAISDTLSALICHGAFERHRNLRVCSIENGSRWVRHAVETWTLLYGQMPQSFRRHPVEQFREHVLVAPYYEESVVDLLNYCRPDRILFGSDYPHPEGLARPVEFVKELQGIESSTVEMIMSTNLNGLLAGIRN
jgi:predicted TIM-barrel fold metal-dependent hydrolase